MFSDPVTAVMTMIMLCFGGMIIMFVFFVRSGAVYSEELREALRKQQMVLADLERQIMEMNFALRRLSGAEDSRTASVTRPSSSAASSAAGADAVRSDGELASMLDAATKSGKKLELGSAPAPSPSASRSSAAEYDPASDPNLFENFFGVQEDRAQRDTKGRPGMAGRGANAPLSIKLDD